MAAAREVLVVALVVVLTLLAVVALWLLVALGKLMVRDGNGKN